MKKITLLLGTAVLPILLNSCSACDELVIKESEVPKAVLDAFRAKYPNVTVEEWEAEKEDGVFFFGAEFKADGKEREVHISPDGTTITEEK